MVDRTPRVDAGSTPLHPSTREDFRVHNGKRSTAQKFFAGLGRKIDQANGEGKQKATPRYQPHNCLPWHSKFCVQSPQNSHHLAPKEYLPSEQRRPFVPGPLPPRSLARTKPFPSAQWQPVDAGPLSSRYFAPTMPPTMQLQSFIPYQSSPGDASTIESFPVHQWQNANQSSSQPRSLTFPAPPAAEWQTARVAPSPPKTVDAAIERIQHLLLHYVCEGDGRDATESQKRVYVTDILKEQLQTPLTLTVPCNDIDHCQEYSQLEKAVKNCMEVLNVGGLTLVPELSNESRELLVHIFS